MTIRFQADADLNQIIVKATLRLEPSIDFQTAHAAGLANLDDASVLKRAAEQGRILVSHDRKTMPGHFGRFIVSEKSPRSSHRIPEVADFSSRRGPVSDLVSK